MSPLPSSPSDRPRRHRFARAALLLVLALPLGAAAQDAPDNPKQFSEKVSEGLPKLKPLSDAKDWTGALALIDELLKVSQPGASYDQAVLNQIKGNIYLQKGDYPQAIEPLETALRVSEQHDYFNKTDKEAMYKYLTQIYYQEALVKGRTPAQQDLYFTKATAYIKLLLDGSEKPNADDVILYAYLLFNRSQLNPAKPDLTLVREAQKVAEQGLQTAIKPKDAFYPLLLATLQQQGEYARSAEMLELMVKQNPTKKELWQQLVNTYLSLGADEKDKEKSFGNNVRAILTYERAQAHGFLNTPKDNLNLVGTYINIGQLERGAELMEEGLKNGAIEPNQKNWEYLAAYYQQLKKELKAIDVLQQAAKRFPDSGQLDFQVAQSYYAIDKVEDAYSSALIAAAKGIPGKNGQTWAFIAYCAFELHKLDEALDAVNKAAGFPESQKDKQLPLLKQAVEGAIKEREVQLEMLKAKQQQKL